MSQGRSHITVEDIPLIVDVVFSTASKERIRVGLLLQNGGRLKTTDITGSLNISPGTAKRIMVEFGALGLVDVSEGDKINSEEIMLFQKFNWVLSEEFRKLAVRILTSTYPINDNTESKVNDKAKENGGFSDGKPTI